jgi:hypothetical protein
VYRRYAGFPLLPFLFNFYAAEMINVQKSRSSVDPAVIMLPARVKLLAIKRILGDVALTGLEENNIVVTH